MKAHDPLGAVLRLAKAASQSRRTGSALSHALLESTTSRRSARAASRSSGLMSAALGLDDAPRWFHRSTCPAARHVVHT